MVRIENQEKLIHSDISEIIIGCCFEIMKELGAGFLENVYKNALFIAMKQKGLTVLVEQSFDVMFRNHKVGKYVADLIVENAIVIYPSDLKSWPLGCYRSPGVRFPQVGPMFQILTHLRESNRGSFHAKKVLSNVTLSR